MIVFDLKCSNGHTFEGWFDGSEDFDRQIEAGLLTCPFCDDGKIVKAPTKFAIKKSTSKMPVDEAYAGAPEAVAELSHKLKEYIDKNFDDVGCDFAKEALKMHYGVSEPRNIRGVSTEKEEKVLEEEGIQFIKYPVPAPPESSENDS